MLKTVKEIAALVVETVAKVPCPAVNNPFYPLQALAGRLELRIHQLQNPWYGTKPITMETGQIPCYRGKALGIIDTDAELLKLVVHGPFIGMAEGKETEHLMLRTGGLPYRVCIGIECQVPVSKHHSLRIAGSS